jgi:hypothetical protein
MIANVDLKNSYVEALKTTTTRSRKWPLSIMSETMSSVSNLSHACYVFVPLELSFKKWHLTNAALGIN